MEEFKKKMVRFRRGKSVFTTTFLLLSAMCIVTAMVMFCFVNWIVSGEQKERIRDLNISQLQRAGDDMDTRMEMLDQNISQILNSSDVISIMVNPDQMDSDKTLRIVSELSGCVAQDSLVIEAFLYLPTSDEVYSSSGNYVTKEDFSLAEEIDRYLAIREEGRDGREETVYRIFFMDGNLFLTGDFCVPNFIGAVFFEIDREELGSLLSGTGESTMDYFLICDEDGNVVAGETSAAEAAARSASDGGAVDITGSGTDAKNSSDVFYYRSERTGLCYLLYVDPAASKINYLSIAWMILPFLIVYAMLAEVYSLYITRKIYRPINRLMQITSQKRPELDTLRSEEGRSELQYLEDAFLDTLEENTQHKELLASISYDMAEQTFRSVLDGRTSDSAYITNTLQGIGMGEYLHGKYMVMAGLLVMEQDRDLSSVEVGLYQRSILRLMEELGGADYIITAFFQEKDIMAVVLCFREDASVINMKHCVAECVDTVDTFTEKLPYTVVFGKGKVYNDILSLRYSWQEALEEIRYLSYLSDETEAERDEAKSAADDSDRKYFLERAQQTAEAAEKEGRENAENMAFLMIGEILDCAPEKRRVYWDAAVDAMMEKMIDCHITSEEIEGMENSRIVGQIPDMKDPGEREKAMKNFFSEAIHLLQSSSRKNRYKYVESAKEYIASHYSDGNLSLNEVSESIGISAPYLSGVFNELNKGSFSSYLKNYRVTQAKNFLEQTTLNVAEIGYKCGFNSAQSFSRAFKKETGFSPGRYRETVTGRKTEKQEDWGE